MNPPIPPVETIIVNDDSPSKPGTSINTTSYSANASSTPGTGNEVMAFDADKHFSESSVEPLSTQLSPPTPPTNLLVEARNNIVFLLWTASSDDIGISHYAIERNGDVIDTTTNTHYIDRNIIDLETYHYRVIAWDGQGNHTPSDTVPVTIPDTTPPSAPTNLEAFNITSKSFGLRWTASTDNDPNDITYYLFRDGSFRGHTILTSFNDPYPMSPNTLYNYSIYAQDWSRNRSETTVLAVRTLDGLPPSKPANLRHTLIGTLRLLTWTNVGINNYEIRNHGELIGLTTHSSTVLQVFEIKNEIVEPYSFVVRAMDDAGNVNDSDPLTQS